MFCSEKPEYLKQMSTFIIRGWEDYIDTICARIQSIHPLDKTLIQLQTLNLFCNISVITINMCTFIRKGHLFYSPLLGILQDSWFKPFIMIKMHSFFTQFGTIHCKSTYNWILVFKLTSYHLILDHIQTERTWLITLFFAFFQLSVEFSDPRIKMSSSLFRHTLSTKGFSWKWICSIISRTPIIFK